MDFDLHFRDIGLGQTDYDPLSISANRANFLVSQFLLIRIQAHENGAEDARLEQIRHVHHTDRAVSVKHVVLSRSTSR